MLQTRAENLLHTDPISPPRSNDTRNPSKSRRRIRSM